MRNPSENIIMQQQEHSWEARRNPGFRTNYHTFSFGSPPDLNTVSATCYINDPVYFTERRRSCFIFAGRIITFSI